MTDAQTALAQVREALSAGPTPGPWSVETVPTSCGVCHKVGPFPGKRPDDPPRHACLYADYPSAENPADDELMANANFIAACSPANIAAILAHVEAQEAEIKRLRTRLEIDQRHPIDGIAARDATIREQDKEIERLRAALRWEQHRAERQDTHGDGCADWGPAHYECAIRERDDLKHDIAEYIGITGAQAQEISTLTTERDDHARWRADLADKLHDRETTISAAWEALRSAGVHSEATIDDGIRLLRRQLDECSQMLARQAATIGDLTRPAEQS